MLLATLTTFYGIIWLFLHKIISKNHPNEYHLIQLLFLRCFTLFLLTQVHSKLTKQRIYKLSEIQQKGFFLREQMIFFWCCLYYNVIIIFENIK